MDMSAAAIAPRQPHVSAADREHPRFAEYSRYRSAMSIQLVEAMSFGNWLGSIETAAELDRWTQHPHYPQFLRWMRENQGGDKTRSKLSFPANFQAWLGGARW